jgi:hypothetical protein
MSNLYFEGLTFTFGATAPKNIGTGSVNYNFTGLSPDKEYKFIIISRNLRGFAGIVGPITLRTLSYELRPQIDVFSFQYVGYPEYKRSYYEVVDLNQEENLLTPSENWKVLGGQGMTYGGNTFGPPQYGAGNTRATLVRTPNPDAYAIWKLNSGLEFSENISLIAGQTYYASFWMNIIDGQTGNLNFGMVGWTNSYDYAGVNSLGYSGKQIGPVSGKTGIGYIPITYPTGSGLSAWQRFIFEFNVPQDYTYASLLLDIGYKPKDIIIFGGQLDTGSGGSAKDYTPNWLTGNKIESGSSYSSRFLGYGNTLYDASPEGIANYPVSSGFTYFWPQHQVRPAIGINKSLLDAQFDEYYTNFTIDLVKALPQKKRAIRPNYFDGFYMFADYRDAISGDAPGIYSGITTYYYGNNGNSYQTIQSGTFYINNIWPTIGISAYSNDFDIFLSRFHQAGATLDHIFWDAEGIPNSIQNYLRGALVAGWTAADLVRSDPRYYQSWNGVTSYNDLVVQEIGDILIRYPGSTSSWYRLNDAEAFGTVGGLWNKFASYYTQKAYSLALDPVYAKYFPNLKSTNYGHYYSDSKFGYNGIIGNGSSPVLYGIPGFARQRYAQRYFRNKLVDEVQFESDKVRNMLLEGMNLGNSFYTSHGLSFSFETNEVTDPNGTYRSCKLTEWNQYGVHGASTNDVVMATGIYFSFEENTPYVLSAYFKRPEINGATAATILLTNFSSVGAIANFNMIEGKTGAIQGAPGNGSGNTISSGMEHVGNSWYRCWVSVYPTPNYINVAFGLGNTSSASPNIQGYTGYQNSLYMYGAQLEKGITPSTLYPMSLGTKMSDVDYGWLSFVGALKEIKSAKRKSYNTPLRPWISNVGFYGEYSGFVQGNFNLTEARPQVGWSNVTKGYNPQYGMTFTEQGGNSAYYSEMLKHVAMHGTECFPMWSSNLFKDLRVMPVLSSTEDAVAYGFTSGYEHDVKVICDSLQEVHEKIGGFTLTTGDITDPHWDSHYVISGAPGPVGATWWWRVTVRHGETINVNGYTLPDINGKVGMWVETSGASFTANIISNDVDHYLPPQFEQREPIYALGWNWPYDWISSGMVFTQSTGTKNVLAYSNDYSVETVNYPTDDQNTGNADCWSHRNIDTIETGFTDPFGGTLASKITFNNNPGDYGYIQQLQCELKPNTPYTYSFWVNTSLSSSGNYYLFLNSSNVSSYSTMVQNNIDVSGANGWQQLTYTFTTGVTQDSVMVRILGRDNTDGSVFYIYGTQLEEGSTATTFETTNGFKEFRSGRYSPTTGVKTYSHNEDLYINYAKNIGATYISPMVNIPSGRNNSRKFTSLMSGWTMSYILKLGARLLERLPQGLKVAQSNCFHEMFFVHKNDGITVAGFTGTKFVDDDLYYLRRDGYYYSSWADNGISMGYRYFDDLLDAVYSYGGSIDQFHLDDEQGGKQIMWSLQNFTQREDIVRSIVADSRYNQPWRGLSAWRDYMDIYGATALPMFNAVYDGITNYNTWNYVCAKFASKVYNEVFYEPAKLKNENILLSNYNNFGTDSALITRRILDGAPDSNSHPIHSDSLVGNASAPSLYGELYGVMSSEALYRVDNSDPTRLRSIVETGSSNTTLVRNIGPSRWIRLIATLQAMRSIKRGLPEKAITPWVSNFFAGWPALSGAIDIAENSAATNAEIYSLYVVNPLFYYESIRHMALTGTKHFLWWNNNVTYSDGGADANAFKAMSDVLEEVNDRLGGYSKTSLVTDRISWFENYIISGAPAKSGGYWWRITPKPGYKVICNGQEIDWYEKIFDVGEWIFTYNANRPNITVEASNTPLPQ